MLVASHDYGTALRALIWILVLVAVVTIVTGLVKLVAYLSRRTASGRNR
jgi:cytochrome b subunit of formate dehydrogenase